ncbi:DUF6455 family protein [Thalassovita sp.]|uniref:DUF6455 family protein n=1 Tax=Thalassovita sp. TaxID=1979401 RepID=UPI0028822DEA|nr:DUF6455 family protein [Thalassovita sp.]MDF1802980.1 DUF6455 family protein [Thalassovita sp.]
MQSQEKIKRHARLVDHMADALGVDIEEKVMAGLLDPEEVADAVLRCTACTNPDDCEHWLETQDRPVKETPDYCRNAELLRELRGSLDA